MKKIIFLCTGNSCRSQMAEGFTRYFLSKEKHITDSAGVESDGLNPRAVKVMFEIGVDISKHYSKKIDSINLKNFDLIVTVCDHAYACLHHEAISGFKGTVIHKNICDPVLVKGSKNQQINAYRIARDEIRKFVLDIVSNYNFYIKNGKK